MITARTPADARTPGVGRRRGLARLARRGCRLAVAFAIGIAAAPAGNAADAVGLVKTVRGQAWIVQDGRSEPAAPGARLYEGSLIRTAAADARIGIALKDNTLIALGPNSELSLDEYRFSPPEGAFGLVLRIARGTLEFVSGMIARMRPESVVVRTPSGTLGVRGTRFLVKVEE